MKKQLLTLSMGVAVILLTTQHTFGQTRNCGERDVVVRRLADAYGETRKSIGLAANNTVLEMYASDETGTWTITITTTDGLVCLVASGQAYEQLTEKLIPDSGNDA